MREVEKSLAEYPSIAAFFVRNLKSGLRPIESKFVSPVDGVLRGLKQIAECSQLQVKGKKYNLQNLLGSNVDWQTYLGGTLYNFYLSPKDYHHIHAPFDGVIQKVHYIPGFLWPVNNFTYQRLSDLFARNERIILEVKLKVGSAAIVLVGAFNVGKISLTFAEIVSNQLPFNRKNPISRAMDHLFQVGACLGTFHLGSSVVLLLDQAATEDLQVNADLSTPFPVRYGQSLQNKAN